MFLYSRREQQRGAKESVKSILVPVDFSKATDLVLRATATMAKALDARVTVMNVAPREPDVLGHQLTRKVITEPVPEDVRERYDNLMACAKRLEDADVVVKPLLVRDDRVRAIIREVEREEADLIVMGSHGRGALYRRIMGSVSEGVLREAKCPVLIIPSKALKED
jgi:nucleotide-binding universal stress UspA family protein